MTVKYVDNMPGYDGRKDAPYWIPEGTSWKEFLEIYAKLPEHSTIVMPRGLMTWQDFKRRQWRSWHRDVVQTKFKFGYIP